MLGFKFWKFSSSTSNKWSITANPAFTPPSSQSAYLVRGSSPSTSFRKISPVEEFETTRLKIPSSVIEFSYFN